MANNLDRNKILDVSRAVFARHGFRKASLTDIVRPLGVAKAALYHHFPGGKREILHAVIQREEDAVLMEMRRAADAGESPQAKLQALIRAKLAH
ncbi:MAG: helix-turn-helix domain containing protein, partial [Syntrophales bacterium]|nr:helix-turn-helix domain containing protein [Syntrophales bacterium]